MATDFVTKWQTPTFVAVAFRNGMGYRYLNVRINSANDVCIGPVTPELTELIVNVRYDTATKLAYFVEYLRVYWTDFRNIFTV